MKHKTFRALLSLVLVCVLLIGWSPIRAQASALPEVAGVVTKVIPFAKVVEPAALGVGGSIFCWVAAGLGILFTAAQAVKAYNDYQDFTGDLETSIYYYPDGSWSYGVDLGFVERVRAFLFQSDIVVPISNIPTSSRYSERVNSAITSAASKPFALLADDGGHPVIFYSSAQLLVDGNVCFTDDKEPIYWFYEPSSYDWILDNGGKRYFNKGSSLIFFGTNNLSYGLADGTVLPIAPLEVPIPEGYPEWHTNARPAVDSDSQEEITILPIPLNPSADPETQIGTLTQPDIWQGSIADPLPDSGTDTDPDTDGSLSQTPWETFKKWISEGWQSIIQAIPTPESIAEAVGNVIKSIFVPDADFISEKWNAIRSRFDFADSISSSGELILDVLNGIDPEPPVIYVDLGDTEGSYYLGGQVAFLDLRWYERYKPTGDAIISAFLWLVFVWRMFIKLPGIIGGLPGDFVMQGVTDLGLADWLPARKKEYENQRQENRRFFKK